MERPRLAGKFLFAGDRKLSLRGVTYGTFRPDADGAQCGTAEGAARDFAAMREHGINALRTYVVPPRWFLDLVADNGLRVLVGVPWEQHVTFLDERERQRAIELRVREGVRACAGHPAILAYAIGNEIPSPIVRWHGRRAMERFIERLFAAAKEEDPEGLVTYVNYPSTEYLELPFLDLAAFNVYLEDRPRLDAYIARLHNLAGDRPLLMAELGIDSRRHGLARQAEVLDWQVRAALDGGCCGAFVFAWTDEWHRGGHEIVDWDFGITDRERRPKPALAAVERAFGDSAIMPEAGWPRMSVVVCSYNGAATLRDCMEGLAAVDYPDFEVIVVNDGSTDGTEGIAREYADSHGFRLITTDNRGLASARNTGMSAAVGEIVAYTDDDARPDPDWLTCLARTFAGSDHAGVGGPNIAPAGDGPLAECVARAPGGPVHVLLDDLHAEHIPGCNMAFRRDRLTAIGGFDLRFRAAGDDVDVCWRLQDKGWTLGFSPAAMVWHHRRNSLAAYWKQQQGYGKAEALLEEKWPEKYNAAGHLTWAGRLYGKGLTGALRLRAGRVYQGTWGGALFQSIYQPAPGVLSSLPLMPEWYLVIAGLVAVSALGLDWRPLLLFTPLLLVAVVAPLIQAIQSGFAAAPAPGRGTGYGWAGQRVVTALLHLLQPLARLIGRLRHGLTPWRHRGRAKWTPPLPLERERWSEEWKTTAARLRGFESALRRNGAIARRGGAFDGWDLRVRGGILGGASLLFAVEEHGAGRQMVRLRVRPRAAVAGLLLVLLFAGLSLGAASDAAWFASGTLGFAALLIAAGALHAMGVASGAAVEAFQQMEEMDPEDPAGDDQGTTEEARCES